MKTFDPYRISLDKTVLIEASAGTGKTYTITTLYCRLIAEGFLTENILVVTFTEAAAAELKLRIRMRLLSTFENVTAGETVTDDDLVSYLMKHEYPQVVAQRLSLALSSFDQAGIFTIHSFCLKILQENAFYCQFPFDIELVPEQGDYIRQMCWDFFALHVNSQDLLFLKFLDSNNITPEYLSSSFSNFLSRHDLTINPDTIEFKPDYKQYREVLRKISSLLSTRSSEIISLLSAHKGIDKRSYSKRNVPLWINASLKKILAEGEDALFIMEAKKDPLYRFSYDQLSEKTKDGFSPPSHEFFDLCQEVQAFYNELEFGLIQIKHQFFSFSRQSLEKVKNSEGICFFDDLIKNLLDALSGPSAQALKHAVNKVFKACLIDEFQDTDPAQYKIFSYLFANPGTPFFMIGDPKQAIYAFRGGDIFAYLHAAKTADERYTLKKNYRSSPKMVSAVNSIFSLQSHPFAFKEIEFTEIGTPDTAKDILHVNDKAVPPFEFIFLRRDSLLKPGKDTHISKKTASMTIPELISSDISALIESGYRIYDKSLKVEKKIQPHDIAVLVRTNDQAGLVHEALMRIGIRAYLTKSGSVFDSKEAVELYDILNAVYEPDNQGYIRAALCTSVFGYTVEKVYSFCSDPNNLYFWQKKFRSYKNIWESKGFITMIISLLHSEEAFLSTQSRLSERGLTNIYHLIELISQAETHQHFSPFYLMRWYVRQLNPDSREQVAGELRLESDEKAVAIVTVHKSKGLEYPVVYLPYLWGKTTGASSSDVVFHDPSNENCLTLDIGSQDYEQAKQAHIYEDEAEDRRLLYVAATRASAMCRVVWAGIKDVEQSALGSMLHPGGSHTDESMLKDLENLCLQSDQCISVKEHALNNPKTKTYEDNVSSAKNQLETRTFTGNILQEWKISSFSSIIKNTAHSSSFNQAGPTSDGKDRQILLMDFYRGARAGDAFHQIFEHIDFTTDFDTIQETAINIFNQFGFSDKTLLNKGTASLKDILETPLENNRNLIFRLNEVDRSNCMKELEFIFPAEKISHKILKKTLIHLSKKLESDEYLQSIFELESSYFDNFLKGFIDLVVCHNGQWYIVDYKTNYLGDTYAAYGLENMYKEMAKHHYFIQYHIYTAALHRYLSSRMKSYSYNSHFGGVLYLFIRGMHPDFGSRYGVYYDCPPESAIDSL